jgi:hypothetical protein
VAGTKSPSVSPHALVKLVSLSNFYYQQECVVRVRQRAGSARALLIFLIARLKKGAILFG